MPFLKQQIDIINTALLGGSLKDRRFQTGRFETIAVDVSRISQAGKMETFPAIVSGNFEAKEVVFDDTFPITLYHKVLGKSYAFEKSSVGDGNRNVLERVDCKMVVCGKRAALGLTAEQLEALITTGFPDAISKENILELRLDSMTVNLQSSNLNAAVVFQEEYKGFELFLSEGDILFSVKYIVESRFRKGCFTICDCENA
jgi:hypothetical protein